MAQKTIEPVTPPQPIKSAEDILKEHRNVLVETLENATKQKEAAKETFHQWAGAEEIARKALEDLDNRTKAE